jgi:hypothetical protein
VQDFGSADRGWRSIFASVEAVDLRRELAPLHRKFKQRPAHFVVGRGLGDLIAFQRVGPAVVFSHLANPSGIQIPQTGRDRFALNQ